MKKNLLLIPLILFILPLSSCSKFEQKYNTLVLDGDFLLHFESDITPYVTQSYESIWFSHSDVSQYKPLNNEKGLCTIENGGFFKNKTPFSVIKKMEIDFAGNADAAYIFIDEEKYGSSNISHYTQHLQPNDDGHAVVDLKNFNQGIQSFSIFNNGIQGQEDKSFSITSITISYSNIQLDQFYGIRFSENDLGGYTLAHYKNATAKVLSIPDSINGKPVNVIGENSIESKSLETINIPDSVVVIEDHAFGALPNLRNILFNKDSKLQTIKDYLFVNCPKLDYIWFPKSLVNIYENAFSKSYYYLDGEKTNTKVFFANKNIYNLRNDYYEYSSEAPKFLYYFNCDENNFIYLDNVAYLKEYNRCVVVDVINQADEITIKSVMEIGDTLCPVYRIKDFAFWGATFEKLVLPGYLQTIDN